MQLILLLLIVPSFVFVGAQGYSTFTSNEPEVAVVGDTPITTAEFENVRRNFLDSQRQRMGPAFDLATVDTPAVRSQLLDDLINQRLLATVAQEARFSVSDEALRNAIAANPAVQDDGQFSAERYRQALAAQGLTPAMYEAGLRRDLSVQRVLAPVGGSSRVPEAVSARLDSALTQVRTVQTRMFRAADYRNQVQVSDADIKAWYETNQKALEIPQYLDVQYLILDEAAATQGVSVSDEQIQQHYAQNQSRFTRPERRRVSHIMIEVPSNASESVRQKAREQADALAKQAQAEPAKFAELAREHSQDAGSASNGGDLGWVSGDVLPPSLLNAAQGLKQDQVSGVVDSPSGFHVLKLTALEQSQTQPLEAVRDQLASEVRKDLAAKQYDVMSRNMTAAVNDQRDSLEPAAKAAGLTLRSASGITRTGLLSAEQVGSNAASASADAEVLNDPRVRQLLFTPEVLDQKLNSSVIPLDAARLLAIRVAKVTPQAVPPLTAVQDQIRDTLVSEKAAEAARQAGEAVLESLRQNPAAQPEGFGDVQRVSRQDPGTLSQGVLTTVLRMPAEPVPAVTGVMQGEDYVLARLESVQAGQADAAALGELNAQLNAILGEAENQAVIQQLREQYKVRITPEAARAIEGEPAAGA